MLLTNYHFKLKDTHELKVKGWTKVFLENGNRQKKLGEVYQTK